MKIKVWIAALPAIYLFTACQAVRSKNTYNGAGETYACTLPDGRVDLQLTTSPLPQCIKLSDLPPEEAQDIKEAAASGKAIVQPGSLAIQPDAL